MNKLINPILFTMCLLAMACSDNNNENETFAPFCLEKRYYEVRLERNATSIPIINGSGDISLAIEDENILNAFTQNTTIRRITEKDTSIYMACRREVQH